MTPIGDEIDHNSHGATDGDKCATESRATHRKTHCEQRLNALHCADGSGVGNGVGGGVGSGVGGRGVGDGGNVVGRGVTAGDGELLCGP